MSDYARYLPTATSKRAIFNGVLGAGITAFLAGLLVSIPFMNSALCEGSFALAIRGEHRLLYRYTGCRDRGFALLRVAITPGFPLRRDRSMPWTAVTGYAWEKKEETLTDYPLRYLRPREEPFSGLDTFPAPPAVSVVEMVSDEVTALCPITNQPDWYEVKIAYRPDALCIESKSLKLYFITFRNTGIFGEAFAAQIADDVMRVAAPQWVRVTIVQKPRGGIRITASAKLAKESQS